MVNPTAEATMDSVAAQLELEEFQALVPRVLYRDEPAVSQPALPAWEPAQEKESQLPRRGKERREQPRYRMRIELSLESEHNLYCGFTTDISTGGLFIATHVPLPVGSHITVHIDLPGVAFPAAVEARVCWLREYTGNPDAPAGMGVSFLNLDARARANLGRYLMQREPIFYID